MITDLLSTYEDDSEYYKIPNLGKHYTLKWEQEDLTEKRDTKHGSDKKKGLSASNNSSSASKSKKVSKE